MSGISRAAKVLKKTPQPHLSKSEFERPGNGHFLCTPHRAVMISSPVIYWCSRMINRLEVRKPGFCLDSAIRWVFLSKQLIFLGLVSAFVERGQKSFSCKDNMKSNFRKHFTTCSKVQMIVISIPEKSHLKPTFAYWITSPPPPASKFCHFKEVFQKRKTKSWLK